MKPTPSSRLFSNCLAAIALSLGLGALARAERVKPADAIPAGLEKSDWGSIRAAYEAGRHEIRATEGGHEALNPGLSWLTKWDGRGFLATPTEGKWQWGLQLENYGFAGAERAISGNATVQAEGQRLTYQWDANVQEWYVNDQRGVEHGFTVAQRPEEISNFKSQISNPLAFTLAVRGGLRPEISSDTQTVRFLDYAGSAVVTYGGLKVWDADGKVLPSHFAAAEEDRFRLLVDERGARYPLTVDPLAQQAYLKPAVVGTSQTGDLFGYSVAASGNLVVIGAPEEDSSTTGVNSTANEGALNSGAAYVFVRNGSVWTQQAYLKAHNTNAEDKFGASVAISGNTIVVGAYGENGISDNAGAAYVFVWNGSAWVQQQYLKAGNAGSDHFFGWSVAISGNILVAGARNEPSSSVGVNSVPDTGAREAGAAYIFSRIGSTWTQEAYLKASNTDAWDHFGHAVTITGDTVVVGAPEEDSNPGNSSDNSHNNAGAAYVYTRSLGAWNFSAMLKGPPETSFGLFGKAVAISGNTLVVGAPSLSSGGRALVFVGGGPTWLLQSNLGGGFLFEFGSSVAISGNTILVGSPVDSWLSSASVLAYVRQGATWDWQHTFYGFGADGTMFGSAVALSGDSVAIGDKADSSNATGITDTHNELAENAGTAYTFLFQPSAPSVITHPATSIAANSARLNSYVSAGYSTTTIRYEFGVDPSGSLTTVSPTTPPTVSGDTPGYPNYQLSGLAAGRTYRFRAIGQNDLGTTNGTWLTFTTAPAAPAVTTIPVSSVTHTTASLDGTVSANGASTSVTFTYTGPDGFARTVAASPSSFTTADTPVSVELTDLLPETTYSFYATGVNSAGTTSSTPVRTFVTNTDPAVAGGVESSPNPTITGGLLFGSVVQPDGGSLLFGSFTSVNGASRNRIARLTSSGTLDASFNPTANGDVVCAAVLNDGKILIGGNFTTLQPGGGGTVHTRSRLARLNANGTVDTTFGDPAVNAYVLCLAVQADGAILASGDFTSFMGSTRNRAARITSGGTLDSFNPNANASVYSIAPQTDGSILLGGAFTTLGGGAARNYLAKVNGTLGSVLTYSGSADGFVYTIALQSDGKAVVGGVFTTMNGITRNRLARLNTNGSLDTGFDPAVNGDVRSLAIQANGKIIVGGAFSFVGVTPRNKLARVTSAGIADAFNPNIAGGDVYGTSLQKNGLVHAAGTFTTINGSVPRSGFAVLNNEAAFETLEKRSDTYVRLNRAASAPQAGYVIFEKSTDGGTTWSTLGTVNASISTPDFILTGISPPLPESAKLRARARTTSGYFNGSAGLTETILDYSHPKPTLTSVSVTDITATSAVFRSTVNANGNTTDVFYNYSVSPTAYDHTVSGATATGSIAGPADLAVFGLIPGTTYHFEGVAVNIGGTVRSTDITFTTLSNLNAVYNTGTEIPATGSSYVASGRNVTFSLNYPPAPGTTLMVVNNTGSAPITGQFANLSQGQPVDLTFGGATYPFVAHYYGGTGNDLVLVWRNTRVLAWGWNNLGQLGNNSVTNRGQPSGIYPLNFLQQKTVVSLSGGTQHSVALCVDGTIATWGDNLEGQLGNGDAVDRSSLVPTAVEQGFLPAGIHPVAISAGGSHTLSLFSNGRVYAWGDNQYGQVGSDDAPSDHSIPAYAKGALSGRRVIGISAGEYHSLAVCDDGFVAAWGLGDSGQLGNGSTVNQSSPVAVDLTDVPPGETIIAVAAGRWHSMALTSGGKVFTWGNNASGQLGDGSTNNQKHPILVSGLTASAIYGGGTMHSMALRTDGKLMAWGSNTFGQLGTGAFANTYTPTVVSNAWQGGQSLAAFVSSDEHNLALRGDGTLFAWGLGNEGRLGDNNIGIHTQPVQTEVVAISSNVAARMDPGDRWMGIFSGAASQHSMGIVAQSIQPYVLNFSGEAESDTMVTLWGLFGAHGFEIVPNFDFGPTNAYGTVLATTHPTFSSTLTYYDRSTVSGLEPGKTYHFRARATRTDGSAYATADDLTVTTLTRLQNWRKIRFETIENSGVAANDADPDNDGISNLLEYAFGLEPWVSNAGGLPQSVASGGQMIYQFSEPTDFTGLIYQAEWSPTLAPGSWLPITDEGSGALHTFKLSTTGLGRAFMRLKVSVAP